MAQAVVLMKGLDACFMAEGNLVSFVGDVSCNLRDFIVNGWPNSKTDVPVSKLCHWFLQDELGYYYYMNNELSCNYHVNFGYLDLFCQEERQRR